MPPSRNSSDVLDPTGDMAIFLPDGPPPRPGPSQPQMGELALWRAVLDDARDCFLGLCGGVGEQWEARRWIMDRTDVEFGFEWVCEHLHLAADRVRDRLCRDRQQTTKRRWFVRGQVHHRQRCERRVA